MGRKYPCDGNPRPRDSLHAATCQNRLFRSGLVLLENRLPHCSAATKLPGRTTTRGPVRGRLGPPKAVLRGVSAGAWAELVETSRDGTARDSDSRRFVGVRGWCATERNARQGTVHLGRRCRGCQLPDSGDCPLWVKPTSCKGAARNQGVTSADGRKSSLHVFTCWHPTYNAAWARPGRTAATGGAFHGFPAVSNSFLARAPRNEGHPSIQSSCFDPRRRRASRDIGVGE